MPKQTNTWLEPLLTRELRRVAAPPLGYQEGLGKETLGYPESLDCQETLDSQQTPGWQEKLRYQQRLGKESLGETRPGDELLGGVPLWAAASGKVRAARRPSNMWFACASAAGLLLASAVGLHAYISNAAPLAGQRAAKAVRFETWVQASTGLNVHGACKLCHADEELRAGISRGLERSLAGAFSTDAGVY
jgi:hypothetical protein